MAKSKVRVVNKHSSSAPVLVAAPEPPAGWARTTVRLRPDQLEALRRAALERVSGSSAKADASELLREIVDGWLRGRS